jgi:hypothetical protein
VEKLKKEKRKNPKGGCTLSTAAATACANDVSALFNSNLPI